ncbi:MAG: MXAN_5808 family serine peptidase [bacterium]
MIRKNMFNIRLIGFILLLVMVMGSFPHAALGKIKLPNVQNITRISRSAVLIQHEYYDPARIKPVAMLTEGLYELAKEVPELLPHVKNDTLTIQLGAKKLSLTLDKMDNVLEILFPVSQIFEFLRENYHGEIKFEDMEYAFIAGMLSILDPHSNILTPKVYKEFKTQTQGEYGGLGIVISLKDKELTVIAPIEDTPAARSGIQADDKILQIDAQPTINMALDEAVDLMRGPPGTKIVLNIKSKNRDPRDVTLTREIINIESVQSKLVTQESKNFGVIRIKGFQDNTYRDVVTQLEALKQKAQGNLAGVILDLRNNAGGLLDQAILTADHFLSKGDIVFTVGAEDKEEEVASATQQRNDISLPMIVLTNEGSASASEIVAGALKNNNRAIVMGQTSFGKGSVQSLFNLRDGSSLKLTVAQYLTPGRESIQAVGITPDIHLYPSIIADDYYDLHEDINYSEGKLDAHLDNTKHIIKSQSRYTLTFLKKETLKEEEEESSYISKIKENDFPLQLAVTILDKAASKSKADMLNNIKDLLREEEKKQDEMITAALKEKNIDWSTGQQTAPPQLKVTHSFSNKTGAPIQSIPAGTEALMHVTITNTGKEAVYRILTDIDAYNPLLNHKEFVFGKLTPGQSKTEKVTIKTPSEIISFSEKVKLQTYTEKSAEKPFLVFADTRFVQKTQPRFSYAYNINDGQTKETTGNKNGIPEPGETVMLNVSLKNLGPGTSEKTLINLKNTEGKYVYLKKARDSLGLLKPNQVSTSSLIFTIKHGFTKDALAMDIYAMDEETKTSLHDTLTFTLAEPLKAEPKENIFQTAPLITISQSTKQMGNKLFLEVLVTTPTKLKDIAIFVQGKKTIYLNVEKLSDLKEKKVTTEVTLEEGINSIVIQARGLRDLMTQKSLSVVYNKKNEITDKAKR